MTGSWKVVLMRLADEPCPCSSGQRYAECCMPIHEGEDAVTAEALMRSRYSAFALQLESHLMRSWHPRTRPEPPLISPGTTWQRLEVLDTVDGGADDEDGIVEFRAHGVQDGEVFVMQERSRFVRRARRWVYLDGEVH